MKISDEERIDCPRTREHQRSFFDVFAKTLLSLVLIALIGYSVWATFKIMRLQGELNTYLTEAEKNKVDVTNVIVKEKLTEIGELATEAYEYNGNETITDARQLFGMNIPGTTNTINVTYCGVVKVGFDVTDIHPEVNQAAMKIYITLPRPKVLDSYIKLDDLQFDAKNNILNPIDITKLTDYFDNIEQNGLSAAEEKDIFAKAENRMKRMVESALAGFSDYEVVFV